jgi:hypothetical protein
LGKRNSKSDRLQHSKGGSAVASNEAIVEERTFEQAIFSDGTVVLRQRPSIAARPVSELRDIYKGLMVIQDFIKVFRKGSTVPEIIERLQDPNRKWGVDGFVDGPVFNKAPATFEYKTGNCRLVNGEPVLVAGKVIATTDDIPDGKYITRKKIDLTTGKIVGLEIQFV